MHMATLWLNQSAEQGWCEVLAAEQVFTGVSRHAEAASAWLPLTDQSAKHDLACSKLQCRTCLVGN